MKKYLTSFLLLFSLSPAWSQDFELRPMEDLLSDIEKSQFTYKGTGLVFGYFSIHSCLYVAPGMAIFKNYCFPKKNYPARGFTILSAKYGIIEIYQEKIDSLIKRDITQLEFDRMTLPYLNLNFPEATLGDLSEIMENLYNQYNPGCWSTNRSAYTHLPEANCTTATENVTGFVSWAQETQELTGNEQLWNGVLDIIEKKLAP